MALAKGLGAELNDQLSEAAGADRNLTVIAATDLLSQQVEAAATARDLFGANVALTGRLQRRGDDVIITATLRGADDRELGTATVESDSTQLAGLGRELAAKVLAVLHVEAPMPQPPVAGTAPQSQAFELYLRGRGLMQKADEAGNLGSAIDAFERALELEPGYAQARAELASAYLSRGRRTKETAWNDRAVKEAERAVAEAPDYAPARIILGNIYARTGQNDQAEAQFQKAIDLGAAAGEAYRGLARVYEAAGRKDEAEQALLKAIELQPADAERRGQLGVFYYRNGRYLEAEAAFRAAMELAPGNHIHPRNLGGVLHSMGRNEEAKEALQRSVAIRPTDRAYSSLGTIYFFEGRYAEAASLYELAIQQGANHSISWGNLADALRWQGNTARARESYQKAIELAQKEIEISPSDNRTRSILALYHAKIGEPRKALATIAEIPQAARGTASVQYRVAVLYEIIGQRSNALDAVRRALEQGYSLIDVKNEPELAELRMTAEFRRIAAEFERQQ